MATAVGVADSSQWSIIPLSIVCLKWLIHFIYGFLMTLPVNKFAYYTELWVNYWRWDCIKCNFPILLSATFFSPTLMALHVLHTFLRKQSHTCLSLFFGVDTERLAEIDWTIMITICVCLFSKWRMTVFCFFLPLIMILHSIQSTAGYSISKCHV